MIDLKEIQAEIWQNKLNKGFDTTNVEKEFNLTYAELSEAYESYRKQRGDVGEELADVLIFLLSLSKMLDVDLEQSLKAKIAKNKARIYKTVGGHKVKAEGEVR
jgi:NTP pyrophosphatase (non-canonical NTP hydrolase)